MTKPKPPEMLVRSRANAFEHDYEHVAEVVKARVIYERQKCELHIHPNGDVRVFKASKAPEDKATRICIYSPSTPIEYIEDDVLEWRRQRSLALETAA